MSKTNPLEIIDVTWFTVFDIAIQFVLELENCNIILPVAVGGCTYKDTLIDAYCNTSSGAPMNEYPADNGVVVELPLDTMDTIFELFGKLDVPSIK